MRNVYVKWTECLRLRLSRMRNVYVKWTECLRLRLSRMRNVYVKWTECLRLSILPVFLPPFFLSFFLTRINM
jgi:hypothetical protein